METPNKLIYIKSLNDENILTTTKSDGVNYSKRNHRTRFFFPHEWESFFDALKSKRAKITFHTLINTGARINEIRNIRLNDIDFKNKRLVIRITKVRAREGEKTPIPRIIPISTQFKRYIEDIKEEFKLSNDAYLPILSTPAANIEMKNALQRINIKDWQMFSVHNVRKTFETWMMSLNVSLFDLATHLGHKTTTAIKCYVSPNSFSYIELNKMRLVVGDLYSNKHL